MNDGDVARRELFCPFTLNGGAVDRKDLDDGPAMEPPLVSFLSRMIGTDHSLSVADVPTDSLRSSMLLFLPPALVEANPDSILCVDEPALMSFSFSFSWKSMKMRVRASL